MTEMLPSEQQKAFRLEAYGIVYGRNRILDKTTNTVIMQLTFLVEQDGQWGILSGLLLRKNLLFLPVKRQLLVENCNDFHGPKQLQL